MSYSSKRLFTFAGCACFFSFYCLGLNAEQVTPSLCSTPPYQAPETGEKTDSSEINIQADKVTLTETQYSIFSGNVDIRYGQQQINAQQIEFQQDTSFLRSQGQIDIYTPQLKLKGTDAELQLDTNQGVIADAHYQTSEGGRGGADSITLLPDDVIQLNGARYTTCDPEQPDWLMSAEKITLDNQSRQGHANNVLLEFKGVPFFYFPYLRFPLGDERLSGFLFPEAGHSEQHGYELLLPFYWNIAPDLDATITPWSMSKRGTMLQTEVRYLNEKSRGQLDMDYLAKDKEFSDQDRSRARWYHTGKPATGWSTLVDVNYVGDDQHFIDFSTDLENFSTTHLNRRATINYNSQDWLFSSNVQSYQTLVGATPYRRLPQLQLSTREHENDRQINFQFESELVYFDHPFNPVTGSRIDLVASMTYPYHTAATYFVPRLRLRHTQYQLTSSGTLPEEDIQRSMPLFSIDSGVVFERDSNWFEQTYTQTLEPQLYYLYVPYEDQSAIPVFDTSYYGFNINNPFAEDRFIGADRIGDANQVTAALATRFYHNNTGNEVFSARIGQQFYFSDRSVTLPGGSVETATESNVIAEIIARPNAAWYLGTDLEWDNQLDQVEKGNARISYKPGASLHLQGIYRFEHDTLETAELGFLWRLNPRWQVIARRIDDILNQRIQEKQVALRYDSCCWGLTLQLDERFLTDLQSQDKSIFLQLELKGLSNIGKRRTISGFE